jgi:hypothetical protein
MVKKRFCAWASAGEAASAPNCDKATIATQAEDFRACLAHIVNVLPDSRPIADQPDGAASSLMQMRTIRKMEVAVLPVPPEPKA